MLVAHGSEALGLLPTNADDFAIYLLAFVTTLFRDGKIVYKEEDRDEERN